MKISDVMTTDVQTIRPDQTAREAAAFMLSADAGSIPVTEDERLIGMITDRDIAVRGIAKGHGPDTPVRDLMTSGVVSVNLEDDIAAVVSKMSEAQVRRLPVVDEQQRLCGIVSLGDLSRGSEGEQANQALEGVSAPGGQHQQ
ncbi:CBS domain-containing protein [Sphingomonas sp.]|uniref:CBS domain-containing protein n=1 Tax=Sphingomonas sp. TaxID=28214 RepID=UPI00286A9E7F|nr:CBS domain-containing protein [Sphingomonas sp.]